MSSRVPMYGLLGVLLAGSTACEATNTQGTAPSKVSSTAPLPVSLAVEPSALRPEFLFDRSCTKARPFGTRVIVVVGGSEISVRSIRFRFTDRFGTGALPRVSAISGADPLTAPMPSITTAMPNPVAGIAPLPSPSPIPIRGSSQFPFFLTFGCGVAAHGDLLIAVDTKGPDGPQTSEVRARIAD